MTKSFFWITYLLSFISKFSSCKKKPQPSAGARGKVEMAGIEPASERIDPRTSTSVVRFECRLPV